MAAKILTMSFPAEIMGHADIVAELKTHLSQQHLITPSFLAGAPHKDSSTHLCAIVPEMLTRGHGQGGLQSAQLASRLEH